MKTAALNSAFVLTLTLAGAAAAQTGVPYRATAPVASSATEQIALARSIFVRALTQPAGAPSHRDGVLTALTALEIVPSKWPNDHGAVASALLLEAEVFFHQHAYPNVLKVVDRLEALSPVTPASRSIAEWWQAKALDRLNRIPEADAAFGRATASGFEQLGQGEQRRILADAGFFHARSGRYEQASDEFRRKADLEPAPFTKLNAMLASIDANLHLPDPSRAREDLRRLDDLLDAARRQNLSPSEIQSLDEHAKSIELYHRKLHT